MTAKIYIESIKNIGKIIQFHRKQAGLSRIGLAEIAGVGKTVIYDIEKGKETIRFDTLYKVMKVLNISISFGSPLMEQYKAGENAQG